MTTLLLGLPAYSAESTQSEYRVLSFFGLFLKGLSSSRHRSLVNSVKILVLVLVTTYLGCYLEIIYILISVFPN